MRRPSTCCSLPRTRQPGPLSTRDIARIVGGHAVRADLPDDRRWARLADYRGVSASFAAGAAAPGVSLATAAASVVAGAAPN